MMRPIVKAVGLFCILAHDYSIVKMKILFGYPQWIAFAKYSYGQLKWGLINKPKAREAYINDKLTVELNEVLEEIDKSFENFSEDKLVIFS